MVSIKTLNRLMQKAENATIRPGVKLGHGRGLLVVPKRGMRQLDVFRKWIHPGTVVVPDCWRTSALECKPFLQLRELQVYKS